MNDVLPDAFIVVLVYNILQLAKPFINRVMPQDAAWSSNALRAVGFVLTYGFLCVNRMITKPVLWPDLWGLLPTAGALYASSALLYHVTADGAPPLPPPNSSSSR